MFLDQRINKSSEETNGIMRIFTDQLNSHISRQAEKLGAHSRLPSTAYPEGKCLSLMVKIHRFLVFIVNPETRHVLHLDYFRLELFFRVHKIILPDEMNENSIHHV